MKLSRNLIIAMLVLLGVANPGKDARLFAQQDHLHCTNTTFTVTNQYLIPPQCFAAASRCL